MSANHNHLAKWELSSEVASELLRSAVGFGPPQGAATHRGLAVCDVPNIRCAVHDLLGRHPRGAERLDAGRLRAELIAACGVNRFVAAYRADPGSPLTAYGAYLRRSHWTVRACTTPKFGHDGSDPVDDLLRAMIGWQMQPEKEHRLILCSHDGGFAESLQRFLSIDDSRVWIVGFLERLSRKLIDLTGQTDRVRLVDIEHHVYALELPDGARSMTRDMLSGVATSPNSIPNENLNLTKSKSTELAI